MTFYESAIQLAKYFLRVSLAQIWAAGFWLIGRLYKPVVDCWSSSGQQRILVIAPHPDDEVIGCAGTLALHKAYSDSVCIAYITDGRQSRALGLSPQKMAQRRQQEAKTAAAILAADRFEWMGLPEGTWSEDQLRPHLQDLIRQWAPHYVYAPSWIDFHPEHLKVANALATALSDDGGLSKGLLIRVYQMQVPLTTVLTNLITDTSPVTNVCTAAVEAYESQTVASCSLRTRQYAARRYGCEQSAEEFWQLSPHHYTQLHHYTLTHWPVDLFRFRGIRFYPLTDPLAYVQGRTERKQLANLVR